MEPPDEAPQRLLVLLALLSTTASTLIKPTGPTLKDDAAENFKYFSPLYPVIKALRHITLFLTFRLPRVMGTKLTIWFIFTLCGHYNVCEVNPTKHRKHSPSVNLARRALLAGITLPVFAALVWFDDHRWLQFFVACLVGDAVALEALTLFAMPKPDRVYFRKDWPKSMLLGPGSGEREIIPEIYCHPIEIKANKQTEQDNSTDPEKKDSEEKEPSDGDTNQDEPEGPVGENLCERVQRLSNSVLRSDVEANKDSEHTKNDILTILRIFREGRSTWNCGHRKCFAVIPCAVLTQIVRLFSFLAPSIFICWMTLNDIHHLLPAVRAMLNQNLCFILYETFFAVCGFIAIKVAFRMLMNRLPKVQATLDGITESLARRTGRSPVAIRGNAQGLFMLGPLQIYLYFVNPVPMTEARLSAFLTILLFVIYQIPAWMISGRMVRKAAKDDGEDGEDKPTDEARKDKDSTFQDKADIAYGLMFPPAAIVFLWSRL
ncbi:hypothetical protein P170DRAFT_477346 [Aspergillus steynii IBT 23096]|uniref:Uncharacterized protein n=1 Tax=Aspergillus steynii IBT 23096 TaxID=1392250 RepID=A0A2I2G0Q4_9EURO|nr:uncharacterized protein P170DRAFT_477346 [Aspergillus steynii IBT 23096]PLB46465.1 hypothetical protein P170DRAFT_477346 [Aspergillus steynii IBT 23096]